MEYCVRLITAVKYTPMVLEYSICPVYRKLMSMSSQTSSAPNRTQLLIVNVYKSLIVNNISSVTKLRSQLHQRPWLHLSFQYDYCHVIKQLTH